MKWAREQGSETYDLWGIPHEDPKTTHVDGDRVAGTKGDDWSGLYKFKVGFGGQIMTYPQTLERRYRPVLSLAVRRLYANRGT
jgi:lipid II:glycine glycyltransferase (peptidoglycan interpeptide bridge formation enzyme)